MYAVQQMGRPTNQEMKGNKQFREQRERVLHPLDKCFQHSLYSARGSVANEEHFSTPKETL